MSEATANVLVNFRLDKPIRVTWSAADGTPLDGAYKPQITAIVLADGTRLAMHGSAILEQVVPDPLGGVSDVLVAFTGMVGYAADHADRKHVDAIGEQEVDYALTFVRAEDGRLAEEGKDYKIVEAPKAMARKLGK